jgi:hypothetical protein
MQLKIISEYYHCCHGITIQIDFTIKRFSYIAINVALS